MSDAAAKSPEVVNMFEAKTNLSRLVEAVESGAAREIVIARNGRPVARLVPLEQAPKQKRLGLLNGLYNVPTLEELNADNDEIARLFGVDSDES